MLKNNYRLFLPILALIVVFSLACNLPTMLKPVATEPVPVSSEAVQNLEDNVNQAIQDLQVGESVSLVITESQLTSLVAFEVQSVEEPKISDVQIRLQNGQIKMNFGVQQGGVKAPGEVIVTVTTDGQGRITSQVDSAKIGPLPLPEEVKSMISDQINTALQDQIHTEYGKLFIDNIVIANGQMTIQGHVV
jgi:uncharacterized protein YpmS